VSFRNLKLSKKLLVAFSLVVLVSVVADVMIYRALNVIAVGVDKNQTNLICWNELRPWPSEDVAVIGYGYGAIAVIRRTPNIPHTNNSGFTTG
jgi:hypothetical protein